MHAPWVGGVLALVLTWCAGVTLAQVGVAFGPKDGAGLTPTDLARVAAGGPAPDFSLESKDGTTITLSDFRARKNVVLVFYRGHW
jgi:cytochrome oxidase Cu insertion factor (SCO1/SenC/PrrC family)